MESIRVKTFSEAVTVGSASTAEAWDIFDRLEPVAINFMYGNWKGVSFPTDHPLDGVLEAYHWHGKRFVDAEHVHPLVFQTLSGGTTNVNPLWLLPSVSWLERLLPLPQSQAIGRFFQLCLPLLSTSSSTARLRLTHYRGKESAAMLYDNLPINDIFRQVDAQTVFSVMDLKGMRQPFFFVLHRE
ncbi:DUF4334 domain-containing protein [Phormidium sp. FACHB-592]|nr:DUF4334 domain-containing protein [Phormidium sp. FACHB-592]MBD2077928.1 DUF4334 domain-containing protein [Phormidium sp. FACHB-592]